MGSEAYNRGKTILQYKTCSEGLNLGSLAGEQQEEANVHGNRELFR